MTILREKTGITGATRLGGRPAVAADELVTAAAPDREAVKASLRESFAEEIEELEQDARKDGLLAAEAEVRSRLQALENEKQQWLAEEKRKQDKLAAEQQASLAAAVAAFEQGLQALRKDLPANTLEIAFAAVTKLLGEHSRDGSLLPLLVEQAVREHALSAPFSVAISAVDHARLAVPDDLPFEVDTALKPGDCVIRCARARVDAGLAQQLESLKGIFLASLAEPDAHA